MSQQEDQPRVKRSRFDTSGDVSGAPAAPAPKPAIPTSEGAKAALEKARRTLETKKKLAETLAKLRDKKLPVAPGGAAALPQPVPAPAFAPPPGAAAAQQPGAKPKTQMPAPLRLDEQGREVDEFGRPIERDLSRVAAPTLKLNQRVETKKKKEPQQPEAPPKPSFYDPEMGDRPARGLERRARASFDFVAHGRFQKQAELQRLRAQYGDDAVKEHRRQEAAARKRDAAPVGDVNQIPLGQRPAAAAEAEAEPEEAPLEPIPDVEWWDTRILRNPAAYGAGESGEDVAANLNTDKITHLVEHPVPIQPPAEPAPAPPMPLMLTSKERKKISRQRRLEREKEKQELISQGLLEPPPPKVKISNLMRVLGERAVADPSAIEAEVRAQMAEREQAHGDRNLARKLTPAERKEKKHRKLVGDAAEGEAPTVSVYRLARLASRQHRFKVHRNAEELHMTGCGVVGERFAVVVAEGGPKAHKKYAKLLLHRIDWAAAEGEGEEDAPEAEEPAAGSAPGCVLAWTGTVRAKAFERFHIVDAKSEAEARAYLEKHGVAHYWDLAEAAVQQE